MWPPIERKFNVYTIKFKDGRTEEFKTLVGADLQGADLRDADLRNVNLQSADLRDANLWNADLRDADLWRANLWDADVCNADLRGANLRNADLRNANVWCADLRGANLRGADFENCKLRHTEGIVTANFGRHTAVAWSEGVNIGCLSHSYEEWLSPNFIETVGKENNYNEEQIKAYKKFIKIGKEYFNA